MNDAKRRRLEKAGWRIGTVQEFLSLSDEEMAFIEVKFALTKQFRETRRKRRLSQHAVAKLLRSSQSRVAKIEAGDASVSLDLLIRALLALGATPGALGRALGHVS